MRMNPVNLLPPHYAATRQQKLRRRQAMGLCMAAGCICAAWAGVLLFQMHGLHTKINETTAAIVPLKAKWQDIENTREMCDELTQKVTMLKRLRDPIGLHAVLARLTQLFPDEAALQSLAIDVPDVRLPQSKLAGSPQSRQSSRQSSRQTSHQLSRFASQNSAGQVGIGESEHFKSTQAVMVELQGLVQSDVVVAKLARELAESGLFRNVRIEDARQITLKDQSFHQFRLSIEIPVYQRPTLQMAQGQVRQ